MANRVLLFKICIARGTQALAINANSGMLINNNNRNSIRKFLQKKTVGKILFSTSALQASRDNTTIALLLSLQQYLLTVILKTSRFSSLSSGLTLAPPGTVF